MPATSEDATGLTAEQFLTRLEEGERWIELSAGELIRHEPPDDAHGNVVRNVGRTLAQQVRRSRNLAPCFDLGLIVARNPDTVWCPAISGFPLPAGFAEADKLITEMVPRLVVEIASTNDRRRNVSERIDYYRHWGVGVCWVFDPVSREVHAFGAGASARKYRDHETLREASLLPGFELRVADAFADPKWMGDASGA